jgi:hypothetical protein
MLIVKKIAQPRHSPIREIPSLRFKSSNILNLILLAIVSILVAPKGFGDMSYLENVAVQQVYYVSPSGSDAGVGSIAEPLRTLEGARDRASGFLAANASEGAVVVYFREGYYEIEETVLFGPEHSGRVGSPIIFAAYRGEAAIISGGKEIDGEWEQVEGKACYATTIPEAIGENWKFNTLYVNGESRTRARTPNYDEKMYRANGRVPRWSQELSLRFWDGDIDPSWSDLANIDIIIPMTWTPVHHRIEVIDFDKRGVELASAGGQHQLYSDEYFRYYLANVFEGLDAPGEWYLNPDTGVLYYYPHPDEVMGEVSVIAPVIQSRLIEFRGDPVTGEYISHLEFNRLSFRFTDTDRDKWNGVYRQSHAFLDAAIYAEGLTDSIFYGCRFENLGEYAVELETGSHDNLIYQCLFRDLGGGGLQVGISSLQAIQRLRSEVDFVYEDKDIHPQTDVLRNRIENCIINRIGTYWTGAYGINIRFASYTEVFHNEIFDTHYSGVAIDARWTDFSGENYCHSNELAYNYVHHVGRGIHSDGGAFYQHGPSDNYYHHNIIHDLTKYPHRNSMKGIFYDAQSEGAIAEKNLIYDTEGAGLVQNWGLGNIFHNNIVAFTEGGAERGNADTADGSAFNHLYLYSNVFISDDGIGLGRAWPPSEAEDIIRDNLFYDVLQQPLTFWGQALETWQEQSGLGNGTVIAAPGMVDATGRDFRIMALNGALQQIGFSLFSEELEGAGIYGDTDWTGLPQSLALNMREKVPHWTRSEIDALESRIDPDVIPEGTIHPVADVYVRSDVDPGTNFGDAPYLQVGGTEGSSIIRRVYLRFDLSSVVQGFSRAVLRMKLVSKPSADAQLGYFVSDDNWDEARVTWENQPSLGALLDSDLIPEGGEWLELDVSAQVREELAGDQLLSLAVASEGAGAANYYSRDQDANYVRPQLVLYPNDPGAVLLVRDCVEGDSWETADVWSDGNGPRAGTAYLVDGLYSGPTILRTPNMLATSVFPGDSLILRGGGELWLTPPPGGSVYISNLLIDGGKLVSAYTESTVRMSGQLVIGTSGLLLEGSPAPLVVDAVLSGEGSIIQEGSGKDTTFESGLWGGSLLIRAGVLRFGFDVISGNELSIENAVFDLNGRAHTFRSLTIDGVDFAPGVYSSDQLGERVVGAGTLTIRETTVTLVKSTPFAASWDIGVYWSDGRPANPDGDYIVDGSVAFMLRTPHNIGKSTFPGNSLKLVNGGGIWIKSSSGGEVTFPRLIADGGRIASAYDNSTVTFLGSIEIVAGGLTFEGNPGPLIVQADISGDGPVTQKGPGRDTRFTRGTWSGDLNLLEGAVRFEFDVLRGGHLNVEGGVFDINGRDHEFAAATVEGVSLASGTYNSQQLGDRFIGSGSIRIQESDAPDAWGPFEITGDGFVDTRSHLGWLKIGNDNWVYSFAFKKWIWMPEPSIYGFGLWAYIPVW